MVQTDKRLLWHPRHENKFVVGGNSQITLYEWAPEYPEIRHVTSQHDLQFMKCFAWSPDPSFDDLIAVGLSTGKVDLIRLEAGKHAQRKNVLSSGPTVTLPVRNSRSCNALAFSTEDPNYLAVGLDKVRGDSSLVIWDISTFAPMLALPTIFPGDRNDSVGSPLSPLSSILPHHPFPARVHPQLPRNETPTRIDPRIIQQHAPTEVVSSLAFLPNSVNLLLAGISHRWLRLFDLRAPAVAPINVASKVQGIATDPYDPHRIACFGDAVVTAWDIRHLRSNVPVVTFSERDAGADGAKVRFGSGTGGGGGLGGGGSYANIEFSNTRRGVLATLERDSSYVRFWDLQECRIGVLDSSFVTGGGGGNYNSDGETKSTRDSSRAGRKSWAANLPWPGSGGSNVERSSSQTPQPQQYSPKERDGEHGSSGHVMYVLADTRRTKTFPKPLSSFALVPNPNNPHPLTTNVMVVNREGDLELYAIHDTPKEIAWSTRGDIAVGAGAGVWVIDGVRDELEPFQNQNPDQVETELADEEGAYYNKRYGPTRGSGKSKERERASRSRSVRTKSREDEPGRGRGGRGSVSAAPSSATRRQASSARSGRPTQIQAPLFGRGDDDGFPALTSPTGATTATSYAAAAAAPPTPITQPASSTLLGPSGSSAAPTGLSATRPGKPRTFSPASVRTLRRYSIAPAVDGAGVTAGQPLGPVDDLRRDEDRMRSRSRTRRKEKDKDKEGKKVRDYGNANGVEVINRVVLEDISMVMRRRAKAGYGLSQPQHNISVTQDESDQADGNTQHLSELWAWIYHSQEVLCFPTSRLHGYDFSYQGLLGIWEGFPPMSAAVPSSAASATSLNPQMQGQGPMAGGNASLAEETAARSLLLDVPPGGFNAVQTLRPGLNGHGLGPSTASSSSTATLTNVGPSITNPGPPLGSTTSAAGIVTSTTTLALPINAPHSGSGTSSGSKSRRSRSPLVKDSELHGSWGAALTLLAARRGGGEQGRSWKPPVSTSRLTQRQVGLQLCGWSLREEEVGGAIRRWEKEGKISRAACWLVFTGQYGKAVELLMRSDDENHQMMSGTVAALAPFVSSGSSGSRSLELREHYGRLIIRLQDPYFRIMLTHLATGDWNDVLEEDVLPFRERLAIAFQFLDDKSLSSYLRRTVERACIHGDIEALIITGLTPLGMNVIQAYLDRTGDVQSAAILSAYVSPSRFWDRRVERWREVYRDLLDGWRLHHLRVGFDIERGQILSEAAQAGEGIVPGRMGVNVEDWAPRQILIRCHYCNKPVTNPNKMQPKGKPTACANCNRELPRCSVCLMTLSIISDAVREVELGYTHHKDTFDDAIVICQTCRHGGHAVHILEWFIGEDGQRTHGVCPVADCQCRCADEF